MKATLFLCCFFCVCFITIFPGCDGKGSGSFIPTPTVQLPTTIETFNGHKGTTQTSPAIDIQQEYALSNWPVVERTETILQNKTIAKHSFAEKSLFVVDGQPKFDYFIDYNRGTIIFISDKECSCVLTPPPPV